MINVSKYPVYFLEFYCIEFLHNDDAHYKKILKS